MWTSICRWFATRFGGYTSAKVDALEARVWDCSEVLNARMSEIRLTENQFAALRTQFERQIKTAEAEFDEARKTIRQLNTALDEERQKVQVHETTINALVASHGLILERVEADTAIEIAKKAAAMPAARE